jgi:hypothetical protein
MHILNNTYRILQAGPEHARHCCGGVIHSTVGRLVAATARPLPGARLGI